MFLFERWLQLTYSYLIDLLQVGAGTQVEDIVASFEHLADSMPDEAQPITDYFEDSYIGRQQRRGRRQPPSAHDMWSVHKELKKVFHVQTTTLKAGIGACGLMLVLTIQAFGIFLMCFDVNNPSTKSSSPRFKPANQHHHNVANTRPWEST